MSETLGMMVGRGEIAAKCGASYVAVSARSFCFCGLVARAGAAKFERKARRRARGAKRKMLKL